MKIKTIFILCISIFIICLSYIFIDFNKGSLKPQSVVIDKKDENEIEVFKENKGSNDNVSNSIIDNKYLPSEEISKKNQRFFQEASFLIDNKEIFNLKYDKLVQTWGAPREIKKTKVKLSSSETDSYIYILKFDDINIEMYPVDQYTPLEKTESFRFDITGFKYSFFGVRVGMTLEEYLTKVENKNIYLVKNILIDNANASTIPYQYKKILTFMKEDNCYIDYDKAMYEEIIIDDGNPYGAVILFKNDIISRIVYGNPNAD